MSKSIIIVQGGQYGSEAKGAVAAELCIRRNINYVVRTGTINAGHTVYYEGTPYKMQTLPTGWVNPRTTLIIGPGAYIHPQVLVREIQMIQAAMPGNPFRRILVDYRAGLHLDEHTDRATAAGRHHSMGATGKGCSEAIIGKMKGRGGDGLLFRDYLERGGDSRLADLKLVDTVALLHDAYDRGESILLEGTQGSLLDLNLGPYPYTTHKPTQATQWIVEAGLAPSMKYETILVCRTFPIRVAGNSGPMPNEIGWVELAREINGKLKAAGRQPRVQEFALQLFESACQEAALGLYDSLGPDRCWRPEMWRDDERSIYRREASEMHKMALESLPADVVRELDNLFERTTVTNKLRRVARWDVDGVRWSCRVNRPDSIALTFANYAFPLAWGATQHDHTAHSSGPIALADQVATETGVPVRMMSFGPLGENIVEYYN